MFDSLMAELNQQIRSFNCTRQQIEVLTDDRIGVSIGEKRNALMERANGRYVSYIDDDDRIAGKYIQWHFEEIVKGVDVVELNGIITTDGKDPKHFRHSIEYKEYKTVNGMYQRFPNHLSVMRSDVAKQFKFPDKNFSEDTEWAIKVFQSGLLKTEGKNPLVVYYYDFISNKTY